MSDRKQSKGQPASGATPGDAHFALLLRDDGYNVGDFRRLDPFPKSVTRFSDENGPIFQS
jgi:hypothetical protein